MIRTVTDRQVYRFIEGCVFLKKILIINNDVEMCCSLALILSDLKGIYDLVTLTSTEDVKSLMKNIPIDLILADVHTPKGDILNTLTWVRENFPEMPVVMFYIAFHDKEMEKKVFEIANVCISKPYENDDVIEVIEQQLNGVSNVS
jgi:two-component system response regulator HydG